MSAANPPRSSRLRALLKLLIDASETIMQAWEADEDLTQPQDKRDKTHLPIPEVFQAQRVVLAATGMIVDMVQEPQSRLMEVCSQHYEARALHIAVERRIADLLAYADTRSGIPLERLSKQLGIKEQKLGRLLRCLCTAHIFSEVQPNHFANSPTSQCLVGNEPLRAWIVSMAGIQYASSEKLPRVLTDPVKGSSELSVDSAFQEAAATTLPFWFWMKELVQGPDGSLGPRSDAAIFNLGMIGGGRVLSPPLYYDYPWDSLGSATIVDVGGGFGGMSLDLAKRYPNLSFVVQDQPEVIAQASNFWKEEMPTALESRRVNFMACDFFSEQPIKGAEVYNLRYILHDWDDKSCIRILSILRSALLAGRDSRILVCDQVMNTTYGSPSIPSAPEPLLANYGSATRFAHMRDLNMMAQFNGRERTPEDLQLLAVQAGLRLVKIWPCRSLVWITEFRLDDAA